MFYAAASLDCNAAIDLPADHAERAAYVVEGAVEVEGRTFGEGTLRFFIKGESVRLRATMARRVALLGGAPLEGERHIWWNFVASSPERIERARRDWVDGKFAKVPGETEFIPLPPRRP